MLFIYITRIASNEKFKYSNKIVVIITLLIITSAIIYIIIDKFLYYQIISTLETMPIEQIKNWKLSLNKYINYPSRIIITRIIIYLFISLIAIVKITRTSYGALRQKF